MTPRNWIVATGSARGARHAWRGEPSEDAFGSTQTHEATSIAVADGHSSSQCPRAKTGAILAVNAALEVMGPTDPPGHVARAIVDRWRQLVDEDIDANPPTTEERTLEIGYLLYGTTLLSAAATGEKLMLFQIGDGDILMAGSEGSVTPAHRTDTDLSTETDSLASHDAHERARYAEYSFNELDVDIVALMTDGFGSAFAEPNWQDETLDDLRAQLNRMEPRHLADSIMKWCEGPASVAGDDTTLALLFRNSVFARRAAAS